MEANVTTMMSNQHNIEQQIKDADLIIGAVLIPGAKAPHLITRDMLKLMQSGTVLVDVAVDQGGSIETCEPTTHEDPVFEIDNVLHYCVTNMPGAVPSTSTIALNNATLPYVVKLADKGWENACLKDAELKKGLNIVHGRVCYKGVSDAFYLDYEQINQILAFEE
jgi:alanine dehydrogenase